MTGAGTRPPPAPSPVRRRIARRRERQDRLRSVGLYEQGLYLAVVVGLLAGAASSSYGALPLRPQPWVVAVVVVGMSAAGARLMLAVGPLSAGPAERAWVLSTPVSRRGLLLPRLVGVLAGAAVVAAAAAIAPALLSGAPGQVLAGTGWFAGATGAALAAACVALQSADVALQRVLLACDLTVVACVVACVVGVLSGATGGNPLDDAPGPAPVLLAAAVLALPLLAAAVAWLRLDRVPARRLAHGHAVVRAALLSFSYLDADVVTALARERALRATGTVRPARIHGARTAALLRADLARIRRSPADLVVFALLLPGPLLVAVLGAPALVGAVQTVCTTLAAHRLARGSRLIGSSTALRRLVGGTDSALHRIHLVWPAVGALVHVGLSSWLAPPGTGAALLALAGSVAVVHRSATRPRLDYTAGAYDLGLLGPLPVGLALRLVRGPFLLAVLVAVQVGLATA